MIKSIIVLLTILTMSSLATATDWQNICTNDIHPSQATKCAEYNITEIQFTAPIKAHKNFDGKLVLDQPCAGTVGFKVTGIPELIFLNTAQPEYINKNDNFKITISEITAPDSLAWEYSQYNPSAKLTISRRQEPSMTVSVMPEVPEVLYSKNRPIRWYINITNTGSMDITDIDLKYINGSNVFIEKLPATNNNIFYYKFSMRPEDIPQIGDNSIHAIASFQMRIGKEDKKYSGSGNGTIRIKPIPIAQPNILFTKFIRDRIYTENNTVTLSVSNAGEYELHNIVVVDRFKDTGITHTFRFDSIKPYVSENIRYTVHPEIPGHFTSPAGFMSYEIQGVSFNQSSNPVSFDIISTGKQPKTATVDEINAIRSELTPVSTKLPEIKQNATASNTVIPQANTQVYRATPIITLKTEKPEKEDNPHTSELFFLGFVGIGFIAMVVMLRRHRT